MRTGGEGGGREVVNPTGKKRATSFLYVTGKDCCAARPRGDLSAANGRVNDLVAGRRNNQQALFPNNGTDRMSRKKLPRCRRQGERGRISVTYARSLSHFFSLLGGRRGSGLNGRGRGEAPLTKSRHEISSRSYSILGMLVNLAASKSRILHRLVAYVSRLSAVWEREGLGCLEAVAS